MEHIKEALAAQERYLRCYGRPSEEDHSLNDLNRDLALAQYDGGKIYNFAYDFCVPSYDEQLDALLRQWKEGHKVCQLEEIYAQIRKLDGHLLLWV